MIKLKIVNLQEVEIFFSKTNFKNFDTYQILVNDSFMVSYLPLASQLPISPITFYLVDHDSPFNKYKRISVHSSHWGYNL